MQREERDGRAARSMQCRSPESMHHRLPPKETICQGQMILNVRKPQAGKGGPAARPYNVGIGD